MEPVGIRGLGTSLPLASSLVDSYSFLNSGHFY